MTQVAKINGIPVVNTSLTGFTYDDVDTFTIGDNNGDDYSVTMTDMTLPEGTITDLTTTDISTTDIVGTTSDFVTTSASTHSQVGKLIFGDPKKIIEGDVGSTMTINAAGNSMIFRHTSTGFMRGVNGSTGFQDSTFPSIDSSAVVTMTSTTKGLLPPRMTTTQRNAMTPATGLMIYNTSTNKHQGYNGTSWFDFY